MDNIRLAFLDKIMYTVFTRQSTRNVIMRSTITELQKIVDDIKSEWIKYGSPRGDHPLFLKGIEANKALAIAKKALRDEEEKSIEAGLDSKLKSAIQAKNKRQREAQKQRDFQQALVIVERAFDYPRCGEDWGNYPDEKKAISIIESEGYYVGSYGIVMKREQEYT